MIYVADISSNRHQQQKKKNEDAVQGSGTLRNKIPTVYIQVGTYSTYYGTISILALSVTYYLF